MRVPLCRRVHASVEHKPVQPVLLQPFGRLLSLAAGAAIDQPGAGAVRGALDEAAELATLVVAGQGADADVRAVEAGPEQRAVLQPQLPLDVLHRARVGGGGQRQPGDLWEALRQDRQGAVLRPEVMAPLADAMRLVDREEGDRGFVQARQGAFGRQALGRDIEQLKVAVVQVAPHRAGLVGRQL